MKLTAEIFSFQKKEKKSRRGKMPLILGVLGSNI